MKETFISYDCGYCYYEIKMVALIYNLYVYPEYRRRGCAKLLIGEAKSIIHNSGYNREIFVQVNPRENSISIEELARFYEQQGLTILSN